MKSTRSALLALFLTVFAVPQLAFAQPLPEQIDKLLALKISGFMIVTTPVGAEKDYQTRAIIELGFKRSRLSAFYQQDFARNEFREGYFRYTETDTLQSGHEWSWSLRAGKTQSAIFDSIPGQKSNRLTRGLGALTNFVIKTEGLRADFQARDFWLSLSHFKKDNFLALLSFGDAYLFWEKRGGAGFILQPKSESSVWFNPTTATSVKDGEWKISLQNFLRLRYSFRLYGQVDYDEKTDRAYPLVGLALTYAKNSNLKLFFDGIPKSAVAEVTFAF